MRLRSSSLDQRKTTIFTGEPGWATFADLAVRVKGSVSATGFCAKNEISRFFPHDFFVFCEEEFCKNARSSGHLGMGERKIVLPQVEDSTNDAASIVGDTPKTGTRNLGDQTVSAESAKDPADLGAGLFGIRGVLPQVRSRCQPLTDVAITKTAQ